MNYLAAQWPAPANIKAYTTLRTGWGSGSYRGNQDPGDLQTREALSALLALPNDPIWVKQTHSNIALEALPTNKECIADATYTNKTNHVCIVLTADCLPVFVCDKQGSQIAVIHAGWRGLANNIIENTLSAMSIAPEEALVWLGPAIGPSRFEVGKDVYDAFVSRHAESAMAFASQSAEKWLADLYALAKIRLHQQGITQVYGGDYCTYSQEDLFFSYRRDKGQTGRMANVIWIE